MKLSGPSRSDGERCRGTGRCSTGLGAIADMPVEPPASVDAELVRHLTESS